jgi:hypothetical protein
MTTKTDLRALMEEGGKLATFDERIMEAVQAEKDSGDDSAGYLFIAIQTEKDDPDCSRLISCASGEMSALCKGIHLFLKENPELIPAFEMALAITKLKSTQTAD